LIALLQELGRGTQINQALEKHFAPIQTLEPAFVEFAHEKARSLAPGLDWEKPEPQSLTSNLGTNADGNEPEIRVIDALTSGRGADAGWETWAAAHPTNFWVMTREAQQLMREERWSEAQPILEQLVSLFPDFVGPSSAYLMLARTYRAQGNTEAEQRTLAQFAAREDEAADAYLRLMELVTGQEDWPSVIKNARRYLAVNPLVAPPYRYLAQASEAAGQSSEAIAAYRAQLELDPVNPAELHYRLARLLYQAGDPGARRQLLQALEEAPRYRAALDLLLEMNANEGRVPGRAKGDPET
jgi:tetratricopeptide (TPR) repeat protein